MLAASTAQLRGADADEAAKERGAESPDAAFRIFSEAVRKDDWDSAIRIMTPRSRDLLVGFLFIWSHQGKLGKEGVSLAAEHGEVSKLAPIIEELKSLPGEKHATVAPRTAALIENKARFMKDVLKLFEAKKIENWINDLKNAQDVKLDRLRVSGNSASAMMCFATETRSGSEDTNFKKVDGRWYFDYHCG